MNTLGEMTCFFFENTLVLKSLPFVTLTGPDRSD